MASSDESVVKVLLDRFGATYAEQAGIRLTDKPSPLYELLVLATLLSARISGDVAVAAAKELFTAGYRTPQKMQQASWQDRVDALGRGHYRRYDERTSTMLGEEAALLLERWHGDLRTLRDEADGDPKEIRKSLTELRHWAGGCGHLPPGGTGGVAAGRAVLGWARDPRSREGRPAVGRAEAGCAGRRAGGIGPAVRSTRAGLPKIPSGG
jgi:hypothetical protein